MKYSFLFLILFFNTPLLGQVSKPEDYGFRKLQTIFRGDTVNILIKSKSGEEVVKKPLFVFCQGSLPIPLMIEYNENSKTGIYQVFAFNTDSICKYYHLAIIGKPFIPVIVNKKRLNNDFTFIDSTGEFPIGYIKRNLPDYYTDRNIEAIKFLQKQNWVSKESLVIAGHSEGSTIAAMIATKLPAVTHLIYACGNPLGRFLTSIQQQRAEENDSARTAENMFDFWEQIVADSSNMNAKKGDTFKATYDFSLPPMQYLEKLKIPVLVCYGTQDFNAPYNDYFRLDIIRKKRKNFTFKAYEGLEHNFFPKSKTGIVNYEIYNWDKVGLDWLHWLNKNNLL